MYCALGFFFFKRKRTRAALAHCLDAVEIYRSQNSLQNEAVALLRVAACQCQLSDFKSSHKVRLEYVGHTSQLFSYDNEVLSAQTIYQVLAMAESGSLLAKEHATPKQLCIVAIAYHNLAVVQLKMQASDAACKSSQNGRKLARLCLSYSNRWLATFHWTHQVALEDVQYNLQMTGKLNTYQIGVMNELTETMFNSSPL